MKQYKISVNGQSYDVTVEELSAAAQRVAAPAAVSAAIPAAPGPQAAPVVAAASPAPQTSPSAAVGPVAVTVKSPMPGTVLSFKVEAGQQVRKGDVLLILEAMKMENEIVAPQDGRVAALRVSAGASVNTGEPLVDLG